MRRPPVGAYQHRVTVLRRGIVDDGTGITRSEFAPVSGQQGIPCRYRELGLRDQVLAATTQSVIEAEVFLRDCAAARLVTGEDRFEIDGRGFAIASAGLPNRETAEIRFTVNSSVG